MTTPVLHHQLWRLIIDEDHPLGRGQQRIVYPFAHSTGYVAKIEADAKSFHNQVEWETWRMVKKTPHARWFAPCLDISPDGSILVQERTTPAAMRDYPARMPTFLCDFKRTNYGMLNGRLVCHDYGLMHATSAGLSHRMSKVKWWTLEEHARGYAS